MENKELQMIDVIGIAVETWSSDRRVQADKWLHTMYGPPSEQNWYFDYQPMCWDLVMRKDIYFMFLARFGQEYATS